MCYTECFIAKCHNSQCYYPEYFIAKCHNSDCCHAECRCTLYHAAYCGAKNVSVLSVISPMPSDPYPIKRVMDCE